MKYLICRIALIRPVPNFRSRRDPALARGARGRQLSAGSGQRRLAEIGSKPSSIDAIQPMPV